MLEVSDEVDLKPSLRACSRGHDFISARNAFLVIVFFFKHVVFSNSLNKERMNGRSKIFRKKDRSPCLFKGADTRCIIARGMVARNVADDGHTVR